MLTSPSGLAIERFGVLCSISLYYHTWYTRYPVDEYQVAVVETIVLCGVLRSVVEGPHSPSPVARWLFVVSSIALSFYRIVVFAVCW